MTLLEFMSDHPTSLDELIELTKRLHIAGYDEAEAASMQPYTKACLSRTQNRCFIRTLRSTVLWNGRVNAAIETTTWAPSRSVRGWNGGSYIVLPLDHCKSDKTYANL